MRDLTAVNLNDYVHVRLTDFGKMVYIRHYALTFTQAPDVEYDSDGMAIFQLWRFINIFGEYIYMGAKNVIEPVTLMVEGKFQIK